MRKDRSSRLRVTATLVVTCAVASLLGLSGVATAAGGMASVTVSDVTVTEGNPGSAVVATFTLKVSQRARGSVAYATANDTAKQPGDYLSKSGVIKLNGKGSKKVSVTVQSDAVDESNETFFLRLSNPQNLVIGDGEGMATILDDDALPALSASDAVVPEGNAGATTLASIDVALTGLTERTVQVDYATAAASAAAPDDYSGTSGTLTFAPGETLQSVQVAVVGDDAVEGDETFALNLSAADQASIGDGHATVTILDNDTPALVTASIGDQSIQEGDKGSKTLTFTVALSLPAAASLDYQIANGSALAPADYVATGGHLDFAAAGPTSQTVSVSIVGDRRLEHLENFFVNLVNVSGVQVADGQAMGEIRDNDTRTKLTKVWKKSGRIHVKGLLTPAHPGKRMTVKLYRYRNGKWVWLRTRRPYLSGNSDTNLDGFVDSSFSKSFLRPSPGSCKVVATFPGDSDHRSSKATKKISC
jgi:Calx-beta domain-containing protein